MRCKMFDKVKMVIDEWDPIELLSIHCPSDEYDEISKHDYVIGCDYEKTKFCLCCKATFDVGILFRLRRSRVHCDVSLCL